MKSVYTDIYRRKMCGFQMCGSETELIPHKRKDKEGRLDEGRERKQEKMRKITKHEDYRRDETDEKSKYEI